MGDIAERVTAAKKQVEDLKKQVASAKNEKLKGYTGINKMGKISHYNFILHSIIWWTQIMNICAIIIADKIIFYLFKI